MGLASSTVQIISLTPFRLSVNRLTDETLTQISTNAEKASVGASRMQFLVKFLCNYLERPFTELFNDITNVNITQSLQITFA
jgi:hypothetical protein